jgi:peptidoglycan LD-endopeptidase CwlK
MKRWLHVLWTPYKAFTGCLFLFIILAVFIGNVVMSQDALPSDIITDSRMSFAESIAGTKAPDSLIRELRLIDVHYYSFDGRLHQGQLVVHQSVRRDVEEIFALIRQERFPVAKAVPIVQYDWSDERSMADNNTSAFNYRLIDGTERLSRHASGHAVDINPRQNPVTYGSGRILPEGAVYQPGTEGTLLADGAVVRAFENRGWRWGGRFEHVKDLHHFQKP